MEVLFARLRLLRFVEKGDHLDDYLEKSNKGFDKKALIEGILCLWRPFVPVYLIRSHHKIA